VDDAGKLVDEISVRDLRGMGWDATSFWRLYGTIRAFKAWEGKMTPRVGLVTVQTFDTLEFLLQSVRVTGSSTSSRPLLCKQGRPSCQSLSFSSVCTSMWAR
jgi:hypothetical protein